MRSPWIESSANQAPLERVFESICTHGENAYGKLIIVQGEAGAGASAFASRLHLMLLRRKIRSVFVPRHPVNADFALYSHYLKSLGLPSSSIGLNAGRKVALHYEAAIQLRRYQAVVFEDAQDYFFKFQVKLQNIYDSLQQLIRPPNGQCVVFCGLRDPLAVVGHRASQMGIDVEYVDLEAMSCDQSYLMFVNDIAAAVVSVGESAYRLRPFLPSLSSRLTTRSLNPNEQSSMPTTTGAHRATSETQEASALASPQLPNNFNPAPEQTKLGAASYLGLDTDPLTGRDLDVAVLHAHTKGLVGNTVSVVLGLSAISMNKVDSTSDTPFANSQVHDDVLGSAALASPKPLEQAEITLGATATDGVIPLVCSNDRAFSGAEDAVVCNPSRLETPHIAESKSLSAGRVLHERGPFSMTSSTQVLLPFMVSEPQRIEWQLELGLKLTDPAAPEPVDTSQGASHKNLELSSAPGNLGRDPSMRLALRHSAGHNCRKRSKAFSGFLTPIHDETLGSWLSRNATSCSVTGIHGGFLDWCDALLQTTAISPLQTDTSDRSQLWNTKAPTQADFIEQQESWNPEGLLGRSRSLDALKAKHLECDDLYRSETFLQAFPDLTRRHITKNFHLPINAVSPENNCRFCAQCLADDVASMRAPGLRQAWRNRGAALCTAHRQPVVLQKLEKGHLSKFSGGWQAYMQQTTRGHFDHGVGLSLRNSSGYQVASVETRICRLVQRIQDWVEYAPVKPSTRQPSKYALYFLLGIFLYQANLVSDGGAARALLKGERGSRLNSHGYEKPTAAQMVKNIESASPRSLAMGYLILGLAFDLIAKDDLDLLRRTLVFTTSAFPITREELKTLTLCFQAYHCEAIWNSALQLLINDDLGHLAWLLTSHQ